LHPGEAALQSRLLPAQPNLKVALLISSTLKREAQKIERLQAVLALPARVALGKPTESDKLGLARLQSQAKPLQAFCQRFLDTKGIRPMLEAHDKVISAKRVIQLHLLFIVFKTPP
jgi:hypothetical protein